MKLLQLKKYFAKYLPVEGEIKEGDEFLDSKGYRYTYQSEDFSPEYLENEKVTKLKLSLCSRDIQIGDIVYSEVMHRANIKVPEAYINPLIKVDESNLEILKKAGFPKVIGEISPDAVMYVQEGQEFSESDVEEWWWAKTGPKSHPLIKYNPDNPLNENIMKAGPDKAFRAFMIRCPWGHFH